MKEEIFNHLKNDSRIWNEEKTQLNQILLIDLVEKMDDKLIELLFENNSIRDKFFIKLKNSFVFKQKDFKFFVEENSVNNSFTDYLNRIGLSTGKKLLMETDKIVIDFPYKDCVLKGGQSFEEEEISYFEYDEKITKTEEKKGFEENKYNEKKAKREEIFFNQVLAQEEIDRLFDEKALINWKRYSKIGSENLSKIDKKNDIINENLIVKGNNLLGLHSLKNRYSEKVKLIFIDPPYNSGGSGDNFTYNNNFKHSTWLTFMKNRLTIAKEFLTQDGFIAITIDHNELFYLGILADEIFGRDNYIGTISIVHKPEGRNLKKFIATSNEFMIIYAKDKDKAEFNNVIFDEEKTKEFNRKDIRGKYKIKNYLRSGGGDQNLRVNKPHFYYPIYVNEDTLEISESSSDNTIEVCPIKKSGQERTWKTTKETFYERLNDNRIIAERDDDGEIQIYEKYYMSEYGELIKSHWVDKRYNAIHYGTRLLEEIIGRKSFSYPKSLYTILDVVKIMSSSNDIVLDFFAGSGTTGHAVLKANKDDDGNRKFLLLEQLEEHIEICIERNQKVLDKENIEDTFIYCELAEWNKSAIDEMEKCQNLEELKILFKKIYDKYFLNYNIKIKEFENKIINEDDFLRLSLTEQKQMFMAMLDLNQLYIQKTEIDDEKYDVSEYDRKWIKEFYN